MYYVHKMLATRSFCTFHNAQWLTQSGNGIPNANYEHGAQILFHVCLFFGIPSAHSGVRESECAMNYVWCDDIKRHFSQNMNAMGINKQSIEIYFSLNEIRLSVRILIKFCIFLFCNYGVLYFEMFEAWENVLQKNMLPGGEG